MSVAKKGAANCAQEIFHEMFNDRVEMYDKKMIRSKDISGDLLPKGSLLVVDLDRSSGNANNLVECGFSKFLAEGKEKNVIGIFLR